MLFQESVINNAVQSFSEQYKWSAPDVGEGTYANCGGLLSILRVVVPWMRRIGPSGDGIIGPTGESAIPQKAKT